jgi:hypothetical protein
MAFWISSSETILGCSLLDILYGKEYTNPRAS